MTANFLFLWWWLQPRIPAAHTQTPTYIVAERAADLIKAADGRY